MTLPLYKTEAETLQTGALPSCTGDAICNQSAVVIGQWSRSFELPSILLSAVRRLSGRHFCQSYLKMRLYADTVPPWYRFIRKIDHRANGSLQKKMIKANEYMDSSIFIK